MRIIVLLFVWLVILSSTTLAISPVNDEVIKEAQNYGRTQVELEYTGFLMPWMSYEENATILDETSERAQIYTPFLLIAAESRDKELKGQSVSVVDSKKILEDYAGYVTFGVTLFGNEQDFLKNTIAVLQQGKKVIKVHQATIPSEVVKNVWSSNQPQFMAQCYFYFPEKDINLKRPVVLVITTKDRQEHRFYFDLARIR